MPSTVGPFGESGFFESPVEVDGDLYSAWARVLPAPTRGTRPGNAICSATVAAVESAGGNLWNITLARTAYQTSVTVSLGIGNVFEREYTVHCGGGCCATAEYERVLSHLNSRATRGGDSDRVTGGGAVMRVTQGARVRYHLVTAAQAFAVADGVAWHGGASQAGPDYVNVELYDLGTEPEGQTGFRFEPGTVGLWVDQEVSWANSGAETEGVMTRKLFTGPPSPATPITDNPEWWPSDATLGDLEYWWDPHKGDVKIGTGFLSGGRDSLQFSAFVSGAYVYRSVPTYAAIVVESDDVTGYGDTEDSLAGAEMEAQSGAFDFVFWIASGPASLGWRVASSPGSVMIEFSWDENADIVSSSKRETEDGSRETLTTDTVSRSFPFQARLVWDGTTFYGYTRQAEGDGWTPVWTSGETLAGLDAEESGAVGIRGPATLYTGDVPMSGVRFYSPVVDADDEPVPDRDYYLSLMDGTAVMGRQVFSFAAPTTLDFDMAKDQPEAIATVVNLTSGATMAQTVSSTPNRNQYKLVSGSPYNLLRFNSLQNGDKIRVTYAAGTTPSGTGKPPRVFDQVNAATQSEVDPEQSTTDPEENCLNKLDRVTVYEEAASDLVLAAGETVTFFPWFAFDPRTPPTLYLDTKGSNLGADSSGSFLWGEGASWSDSSKSLLITWTVTEDEDGIEHAELTGVEKRPTTSGALEAVTPFTGATYLLPFQFRITRVGSDLRIYHRQESPDAWVASTAAVTLSALVGLLRTSQPDMPAVDDTTTAAGDFDITTTIGSGAGSWKKLTTDNYLARWAEGLVLLRKDFVDSLGVQELCLLAVGYRGRAGGGFDAEIANEFAAALSACDQLWCSGGTASGTGREMSGYMGDMTVGYTGWSCHVSGGWVPTGVSWGEWGFNIRNANDGLAAEGASWPVWYSFEDRIYYWDLARRSTITSPGTATWCPSEPTNYKDSQDLWVAEEAFIDVTPFHPRTASVQPWWTRENYRVEGLSVVSDPAPAMDNFFGGTCGLASSLAPLSIAAQFSLSAVPFPPSEIVSRLPTGATILEAKIEARFQGFRTRTWEGSFFVNPDLTYGWDYSEQGELISRYRSDPEESFTILLYPDPATSGEVTFTLFGRRRDTTSITAYTGDRLEYPSDTYLAIGGGVTTGTLTDGEWGTVDVTGMMQALYADLDSGRTSYFLCPSKGGVSAESDVADFAALLRGSFPSHAEVLLQDLPDYGYSMTCSGSFSWYSSLELRLVLLRYQVGTQEFILPLLPPPAMPAA